MLELPAAAPVSMTSTLRLRKGAARFEDYRALGVDTDIALDWRPDQLRARTERVQVGQIDLGYPVTDLQSAVHYESKGGQSRLQVSALQAQVLGGSATINEIHINPEQPQGPFTVELHNLSVAQVLALEGEDISGTGTLDGLLPVEITNDGVQVIGGELRAQPPGGVIRLSDRFTNPTG